MIEDPISILSRWVEDAKTRGIREPDAMVLATVDAKGAPAARVVLCRGFTKDGALRFFTNYESRKARELAGDPRAAAVFHWADLGRQARVEGTVSRLPAEESDAYFAGRHRLSQLGAWVSPQSRTIASLDALMVLRQEKGDELEGKDVPRPPFWGGYALAPRSVELWTSGEGRFHVRRLFEKEGGSWRETLLAP